MVQNHLRRPEKAGELTTAVRHAHDHTDALHKLMRSYATIALANNDLIRRLRAERPTEVGSGADSPCRRANSASSSPSITYRLTRSLTAVRLPASM